MADSPLSAAPKFRFSVFEADAATGELRKHGIRLRLADQPFNVLIALLERPGELVTREELVKRLWPDGTFVDYDHSLNTAVNKLREVLGDSATTPRFIETLPKRGYRFVGSAERIAESALQHAPEAHVSEAQADESSRELPQASRSLVRTLFILAQIMYLGFYIAALVNWSEIHWLVGTVFGDTPSRVITTVVLVTAMVGIPLRLFLLTAVAWDYMRFRQKYDRMFLAIATLDLLWGVSPLLTSHHIGIGITLSISAMLLYLTFGQRTLVQMAYE